METVKLDPAIVLVLQNAGLDVSKATDREIALADYLLKQYGHINSAASAFRRQLGDKGA